MSDMFDLLITESEKARKTPNKVTDVGYVGYVDYKTGK
mgnify:CR=1 FL=1